MLSTLCPSPVQMSTRRVPLNPLVSNVSPFTNVNTNSTSVPLKRQIRTTQAGKESLYGQPPAKRQILEADVQQSREKLAKTVLRTPSKQVTQQDVRRDLSYHQPAALQASARVKPRTRTGDPPPSFQLDQLRAKAAKTSKPHPETNAEAVENIRVWQRHYRKAFPNYVFYFESVPEESKHRLTKTVNHLQARVEPFFSKDITHVITLRAVPTKQAASAKAPPQTPKRGSKDAIINPMLLDKASSNRLFDDKRAQTSSTDVLRRALDFDMKIWTYDKFERILQTMLDPVPSKASTQSANSSIITTQTRTRDQRAAINPDPLARALRDEKFHGPLDRDHRAPQADMVYFKGPYILVSDMTKVHRPILMREYPKATNKDEITWPRFRSTGHGRCPWIEDPSKKAAKIVKDEKQRRQDVQDDFLQKERALKEALRKQETEKLQRELEKADKILKKYRDPAAASAATLAKISTNMSPPPRRMSATIDRSQVSADLGDIMKEITGPRKASSFSIGQVSRKENAAEPQREESQQPQRPFSITQKEAVRVKATTTDRNFPPKAQIQTSENDRPHRVSRMYEPVASGLQVSNMTSAIRSQVISSNAAQLGSKAGLNKDMLALKRKVFEKTNTNADSARAGQPKLERANTVPLKRGSSAEDKENCYKRPKQLETLTTEKKASTPGYCENCREKFDDFDDHIQTKKHRRFAEDDYNFVELDNLLIDLQRPERPRWYSQSP